MLSSVSPLIQTTLTNSFRSALASRHQTSNWIISCTQMKSITNLRQGWTRGTNQLIWFFGLNEIYLEAGHLVKIFVLSCFSATESLKKLKTWSRLMIGKHPAALFSKHNKTRSKQKTESGQYCNPTDPIIITTKEKINQNFNNLKFESVWPHHQGGSESGNCLPDSLPLWPALWRNARVEGHTDRQ